MNQEQRAALRKLAEEATPGPWMRLFGERTVYDRMEDGCRGNVIVRADYPHSKADGENLDYIAAANPSTILQLLDYIETLEKDAARYRFFRELTWCESSLCAVMHPKNAVKLGYLCPSKEHLDAVIDAAMQGETE